MLATNLPRALRALSMRCAAGLPARVLLPSNEWVILDGPLGASQMLVREQPMVLGVAFRCPRDGLIDAQLARRYGPHQAAWPARAFDGTRALLRTKLAVLAGRRYAKVTLSGLTSDAAQIFAESPALQEEIFRLARGARALCVLEHTGGPRRVLLRLEAPAELPAIGEATPGSSDQLIAEMLALALV